MNFNLPSVLLVTAFLVPAHAQQGPSVNAVSTELTKLRQELGSSGIQIKRAKAICDELILKANQTLAKDNSWRLGAEVQCLKVEHEAGNSQTAISGLEQLLPFAEKLPGKPVFPFVIHQSLIDPYRETGRPDLALSHANSALRIVQPDGGVPGDLAQSILAQLCGLNVALRQYEIATQQCRTVIQTRSSQPSGDVLRNRAKLDLIAMALNRKPVDSEGIISALQAVISELDSATGKTPILHTIALSLLSDIYLQNRNFLQAEKVLKDGIREFEAKPSTNRESVDALKRRLENFYIQTAQYDKAQGIKDASSSADSRQSDQLSSIVQRANAATALFYKREFAAAIAQYEDVLTRIGRSRAAVNLNAETKAAYFSNYRSVSNLLAVAYARNGDALSALLAIEDSKGQAFTEQMLAATVMKKLQGEDLLQADSARQKLAAASGVLALESPTSTRAIAAEKERFDAQADLDKLIDKNNSGANRLTPPSRDAIRESLQQFRDGHIYISWMATENDEVVAFVVRDGKVYTGDLDRTRLPDLAKTIDVFRQALMRGDAGLKAAEKKIYVKTNGSFEIAGVEPADALQPVSASLIETVLSRRLLASLAPHFQGVKRVTISPDGPLWLLPFEALQVGNSNLISTADVGYVPSLAWALSQEARQKSRKPSLYEKELLAVGAPIFRSALTGSNAAVGSYDAALLRQAQSKSMGSFLSTLALLATAAPELPGSRIEVEAIAAHFSPKKVTALIGAEATEKNLSDIALSGGLSEFRRIHIATHGISNSANPMLSALLLGKTSNRTAEDGYLTAQEIATWNIDAELVVLSACDSAVGKIVGGEGVMGLAYAFSLAGARNTVQTLWPIPDGWTSQFMASFYKRLGSGMNANDALSATKREAYQASKKNVRTGSTAQPWAAFVMYGM